MIFKSKYELYEFLLAPSPEGAFAGVQKKRKINKCLTNGLPRGQERVRRGSWACLELTEP